MDELKVAIYRAPTHHIRNVWWEIVHHQGELLECTRDMGWAWLARAVATDAVPRMLPKDECRKLTVQELGKVEILLRLEDKQWTS